MRNYAPHTEVSDWLQDWHPREAKPGKNGTFIDGTYTGSQTGSLVSELGPSPGQCPGVEMIRSPFPRMPPQSSREQRMPYPADAGKLAPTCLAHSPASISQLRAFSSIDKVRLLLARVPWEGSRRFPLSNVPWVAAAAPRVKDMPVSHGSFPAAGPGGPAPRRWPSTLSALHLHRLPLRLRAFPPVSEQVFSCDRA